MKAPTGIALWVTEVNKPPDHNTVMILQGDNIVVQRHQNVISYVSKV